MALDAERLAAYVDGRLSAGECAEIECHLAECPDCRAIVAGAAAFVASEGVERTAIRSESRRKRSVMYASSILAAAAAVLVAIRVIRPDAAQHVAREGEFQSLISAVSAQSTRPVEGRISGFRYAPPPTIKRGSAQRVVPADVRIAAARLITATDGDASAQAARDRGVANLVLGNLDAAIRDLTDAASRDSSHADFLSDLAAAHVANAAQTQNANEWRAALDAADRALKLSPRSADALFNRALALQRMGDADRAVKAWRMYVDVETDPAWSAEARQRMP
jgi:tetratricopeptide (TPR) repeat protein